MHEVGLQELILLKNKGENIMAILDKLWKTPITLLSDLVGLFVVPIALIFCKKEDDHLPHWAFLWCNEWDSINGYSNDNGWLHKWGPLGIRKYWPRFLWLAVRNRSSNLSQILGKEDPSDDETCRGKIRIPFTQKYFKLTWGYTSYYPGAPGPPTGPSLRVMPKKNFICSISIRTEDGG